MSFEIHSSMMTIVIGRMGDVVDKFRMRTLGLLPLALRSGPGVIDRLNVPWTYCMSPSLVPKPPDWKNHIGMSFHTEHRSSTYINHFMKML